ncbi:MAG: hypothetical protein IMW89_12175 [Ktedonobacteraceae bacterium]|nr:hypothetical protein [Ktedonobacteraceae bacterium]
MQDHPPLRNPSQQTVHRKAVARVKRSSSVPPRASASPARSARERSRHARLAAELCETDITRIPTTPSAIWQYEAPGYAAESSTSSLSLFQTETAAADSIDELDTIPPPAQQANSQMPDITEVDTVPSPLRASPGRPALVDIADLSTLPFSLFRPARTQLSPVHPGNALPLPDFAGNENDEENKEGITPDYRRGFDPLDRIRWWLLYPGRIEYLLWLCGTTLLIGLTVLLLLTTLLNTGLLRPGTASSAQPLKTMGSSVLPFCEDASYDKKKAGARGEQDCMIVTVISPSGLKLVMMKNGPFVAGESVQLHGEGFHARGRILLTHDHAIPCQPESVQADAQGTFTLALQLSGPGWEPQKHVLTAYDTVSQQSISLSFTLSGQASLTRPSLPAAR